MLVFTVFGLTPETGGSIYYNFSGTDDLWGTYPATNNGADVNATYPTFGISGDSRSDSFNFIAANNDYLNHTSPNLGSTYSVSFWINFNSNATLGFIIGGDYTTDVAGRSEGDSFVNTNGRIYFGCHYENNRAYTTEPLVPNTWYHIVGLCYGKFADIYVNGVLNASSGEQLQNAGWATKRRIGRRGDNTYPFDGGIDEVKYYDAVLNATQISNLYKYGSVDSYAPTISSSSVFINSSYRHNWTVENLTFVNITAATDTDSTKLKLKWFKDNVAQTALENLTNIAAGNTRDGETWLVEVSPYDGTDYGTAVNTSSLTIKNVTLTNVSHFEFDDVRGEEHEIVKINSTHYLDIYYGDDTFGKTAILKFNPATESVTNVSHLLYENEVAAVNPTLVKLNDTYYLATYSWNGTDGYAFLLKFNPATETLSNSSYLCFEEQDYSPSNMFNDLIKINDTHFLASYGIGQGTRTGFNLVVLKLDSANTLTNVSNLYMTTTIGIDSSLVQINSTYYLATYSGNGNDGYAVLLKFDAATETLTNVTTLEFDETNGRYNSLVKINNSYFLNTYSGTGSDGYAVVLRLNSDDTLTNISHFEFDESYDEMNSLKTVNDHYFINSYSGPDTGASTNYDGYTVLLEFDKTTETVTNISSFEFEQNLAEDNSLVQINNTHFLDVYTGAGLDAYAAVLKFTDVTAANSAPSITAANLNLNASALSNYTNESLTLFNITAATDADGDSTKLKIKWFNNSIMLSALENQTTITASNTTKGDSWIAEVLPYDGTVYGTGVNTSSLTIRNYQPNISLSNLILNSTLGTNKTSENLTIYNLTAASDIDGDHTALLLKWFKNNTIEGLFENNSVIVSSATTKKETWLVEVTPDDGSAYGTSVNSSPLFINNTLPTYTYANITPTTAYTNSTLQTNVTIVSDPDSDIIDIVFNWFKNALSYFVDNRFGFAAGNTVNSTLTGGNFSKGDNITVQITVGDRDQNNTAFNTSNVTILNSLPTIDVTKLVLNTSGKANITIYNLTFWNTSAVSDADSDSTSLKLKWFQNNTVQSAWENNTRIYFPNTTAYDTNYTLEVTPYDGVSYGTSINISVLINCSIINTYFSFTKDTYICGLSAGAGLTTSTSNINIYGNNNTLLITAGTSLNVTNAENVTIRNLSFNPSGLIDAVAAYISITNSSTIHFYDLFDASSPLAVEVDYFTFSNVNDSIIDNMVLEGTSVEYLCLSSGSNNNNTLSRLVFLAGGANYWGCSYPGFVLNNTVLNNGDVNFILFYNIFMDNISSNNCGEVTFYTSEVVNHVYNSNFSNCADAPFFTGGEYDKFDFFNLSLSNFSDNEFFYYGDIANVDADSNFTQVVLNGQNVVYIKDNESVYFNSSGLLFGVYRSRNITVGNQVNSSFLFTLDYVNESFISGLNTDQPINISGNATIFKDNTFKGTITATRLNETYFEKNVVNALLNTGDSDIWINNISIRDASSTNAVLGSPPNATNVVIVNFSATGDGLIDITLDGAKFNNLTMSNNSGKPCVNVDATATFILTNSKLSGCNNNGINLETSASAGGEKWYFENVTINNSGGYGINHAGTIPATRDIINFTNIIIENSVNYGLAMQFVSGLMNKMNVYGSDVRSLLSSNPILTINNSWGTLDNLTLGGGIFNVSNTTIGNLSFSGTNTVNFTSLCNVTGEFNYKSGTTSMYGFLDMPSSVIFTTGTLNRYYDFAFFNASGSVWDQTLNVTVVNGLALVHNVSFDSSGAGIAKHTFASTNYDRGFNVTHNGTILNRTFKLSDDAVSPFNFVFAPLRLVWNETDSRTPAWLTNFTLRAYLDADMNYDRVKNVSFNAISPDSTVQMSDVAAASNTSKNWSSKSMYTSSLGGVWNLRTTATNLYNYSLVVPWNKTVTAGVTFLTWGVNETDFGRVAMMTSNISSAAGINDVLYNVVSPNGSRYVAAGNGSVVSTLYPTQYWSSPVFTLDVNGTWQVNQTVVTPIGNVTQSYLFNVIDRWVVNPESYFNSLVTAVTNISFNMSLDVFTGQALWYDFNITNAAGYNNSNNFSVSVQYNSSNITNSSLFLNEINFTPSASITNGTYIYNLTIFRRQVGFARQFSIPITISVYPPAGNIEVRNTSGSTCSVSENNCNFNANLVLLASTGVFKQWVIHNTGGRLLENCTPGFDGDLADSLGASSYAFNYNLFNVSAGDNVTLRLDLFPGIIGEFTGYLNLTCIADDNGGLDSPEAGNRPAITLETISSLATGTAFGGAAKGGAAGPPLLPANITLNITRCGDGVCDPGEDKVSCPSDCGTVDLDALFCIGDGPCLWKQSWFIRVLVVIVALGLGYLIISEEGKKALAARKKKNQGENSAKP